MPSIWSWLFYGRTPCPQTPAKPEEVKHVEPVATAAPEAKPAASTAKERMAAAIAAAVVVAAPLTAGFEGLRLKPYKDPVGISTVCYGETNVPMKVYSKDECGVFLRKHLAEVYAPPLLKCVPALVEPARKHEFAALLDFSYNAGPAAACRSPMAKDFIAGRWESGCRKFSATYVTKKGVKIHGYYASAGGKEYPGLVRRRADETKLCLRPE